MDPRCTDKTAPLQVSPAIAAAVAAPARAQKGVVTAAVVRQLPPCEGVRRVRQPSGQIRLDARSHGTLIAAAAAAPPRAPPTLSPAAAATGEGEPCSMPEPCPVLPVLPSGREALADAVARAAAAAPLLTCRAAEHSTQHAVV